MSKPNPNNVVKQIKMATRRKFSADEKIRIVLEGLRGEISISELSRKEGIAASVYYKWSKDFLQAGTEETGHAQEYLEPVRRS